MSNCDLPTEVLEHIIKGVIRELGLQGQLKDCSGVDLAAGAAVASCSAVEQNSEAIQQLTAKVYKDCDGNAIDTETRIATCANLNSRINALPKLIAGAFVCDPGVVRLSYSDGSTKDINMSCLLDSLTDTHVNSVTVTGNNLTVTLNDGSSHTAVLPSGGGGTGTVSFDISSEAPETDQVASLPYSTVGRKNVTLTGPDVWLQYTHTNGTEYLIPAYNAAS